MSHTHLRKQGSFVPRCDTRDTALRTTANPAEVDCPECRRLAKLGKYDAKAVLAELLKAREQRSA